MVLEILAVVLKDWIPGFLSAPNFYFKAIPRFKKKKKKIINKKYTSFFNGAFQNIDKQSR